MDLLASGKSITDSATAVEVTRQTVSEWPHHYSGFQAALNSRRQELWEGMTDTLRGLLPKALALVLPAHLSLSMRCTHLQGYDGLKYAVRAVVAALPQQHFILKTDVRAYYASIDYQLLLDRLTVHSADQQVLNLIGQYLRRCAEWGGLYWDHR